MVSGLRLQRIRHATLTDHTKYLTTRSINWVCSVPEAVPDPQFETWDDRLSYYLVKGLFRVLVVSSGTRISDNLQPWWSQGLGFDSL